MRSDNGDWLLCLNSQLQLHGEALTKQPVQSSSTAWRALRGADTQLRQSRRPQYSAQRAPSQQHQHSSWNRLWEAHSCLPALPRCSALFRLSLSSPQKNNSALLCHPVRRFNTSNGQLPKGTWKRGDENHRVLFWNYRPQQLVALCKRGSLTGSSLCYRGWTGMEMLRVQE